MSAEHKMWLHAGETIPLPGDLVEVQERWFRVSHVIKDHEKGDRVWVYMNELCPVHKIRDCSPLLNGCSWQPRPVAS